MGRFFLFCSSARESDLYCTVPGIYLYQKTVAADVVDFVSQVDVDLMVDLSRPNALLFAECSVCSTRVLKSVLSAHERFCRGATDRQARLLLDGGMSSTQGASCDEEKNKQAKKRVFRSFDQNTTII